MARMGLIWFRQVHEVRRSVPEMSPCPSKREAKNQLSTPITTMKHRSRGRRKLPFHLRCRDSGWDVI